jgi:hypothetical protein
MIHDEIISTVIDNNGIIIGGYVREWVRYGEPQNTGWNDIDVLCPDEESKKNIKQKLKEINLIADFRATPPFNDFFCNCWMFDGKIKPVESKDKKFSVEEIEDQTKSSIAAMMETIFFRVDKIQNFLRNNWKIQFPNGNIPSIDILQSFLNQPSIKKAFFNIKPLA